MSKVQELLHFIENSPTAFHAVETAVARLQANGFSALEEGESWQLEPGHGYYVTRNRSSVIAFRMPTEAPEQFLISASHTDSPMFKLKEEHLAVTGEGYRKLLTEMYGGTILSSWFDRPLSLAGRVVTARDGAFVSHLVNLDRDLLIIPNLAIHLNRSVNSGYNYNLAVDTLPLLSLGGDATVKRLVAEELGVAEDDIRTMELYVYNRTKGATLGAQNEFFSSPRIDNLMCMWGTLEGFLQGASAASVNVYFAADNEEVGSTTKQGAGSRFLSDTLSRIAESLGADPRQMLARSMMVSADNAHAKHPNHPEMSDAQNFPLPGGGVVIKRNAAQKYTTDAMSAALFADICTHAGVPIQHYANRSDLPGGSTLGAISNTQAPLLTVDIGMAQLAMHSAYETAGVADADYLCRAMQVFYSVTLHIHGDGQATLTYCDTTAN